MNTDDDIRKAGFSVDVSRSTSSAMAVLAIKLAPAALGADVSWSRSHGPTMLLGERASARRVFGMPRSLPRCVWSVWWIV